MISSLPCVKLNNHPTYIPTNIPQKDSDLHFFVQVPEQISYSNKDKSHKILRKPETRLEKAETYVRTNENMKALRIYLSLLRKDVKNVEFLLAILRLYTLLNNYPQAIKYSTILLQLDPKSIEIRKARAYYFFKVKEIEHAIQDCDYILKNFHVRKK